MIQTNGQPETIQSILGRRPQGMGMSPDYLSTLSQTQRDLLIQEILRRRMQQRAMMSSTQSTGSDPMQDLFFRGRGIGQVVQGLF